LQFQQRGKKNFEKFFDKSVINRTGKLSGFVQRICKKTSAYHFVFGFLFSCCHGKSTFNKWALQLSLLSGERVSRQAVFDRLNHFYLGGGTALSLQYGHRLSEDIDLFSEKDPDNNELEKLMRFYFADIESTNFHHTAFGIYCQLDNIKVDFMKWSEEWIGQYETENNIRIASDEDIFSMKLQAAMTRGAKKDFFDLALLIEKYSLNQGIEWYRKKYPCNDDIIPLKSLTDFEMAEDQTKPILLKRKDWENCKTIIINAVKEYVENGQP